MLKKFKKVTKMFKPKTEIKKMAYKARKYRGFKRLQYED